MLVGDTQQIPLDLGADDTDGAALVELLQRLAQQRPRREMEWLPVVEIFIAENPADARRPGQHSKRRGIWNDGKVGRAAHLGKSHAATARE
jgi:hypothetical protein